MSESIKGFNLSGDEAFHLKDRSFTIVDKPFYDKKKDMNDPEKEIEILTVPIALANGIGLNWTPNKTSQKSIIAKKGRVFDDWVGFKGEFDVVEQKVGKDMKKVIYIA